MVDRYIWLSMRHFLTNEYKNDIYMGQQQYSICNTNLKSNGYLEQLDSCIIFASPLRRCQETVKFIIKRYPHLKSEIIYLDGLKERGLGDFEGKNKKIIRQDDRYFVNGKFVMTMTPPNGESLLSFRKRVENAVRIVFQGFERNNVLVISHLQTMRMIRFCVQYRYDYEDWYNINYNHGEVVKENYEKE